MFIFPESTSHLTLFGMHKLIVGMSGSIGLTKQSLVQYPMQDSDDMQALKAGLIRGWSTLEPALGFLPLDLSFGNWNAQDILSLHQPLRLVLVNTLSLLDYHINACNSRDTVNQLNFDAKEEESFEQKDKYGKHQVLQSLNLVSTIRHPDVQRSVLDSYHALSETSDSLMQAIQHAYAALADSIQQNNSRRWFGRLSPDDHQKMRQRHEVALESLREERLRFPAIASKALLDSHEHLFDEAGKFKDKTSSLPKLSGLFMGFNLEERIIRLAEALERPLAQVILLEAERTTCRVWFPVGVRKAFAWAFGREPTPALNPPTSEDFPVLDETALEELHGKLKATARPVKKRNKTSAIILGFAHWISNDEGIYALRVLVATMAVAVVAVTGETAGFFYREKGLWAVIMAQTGLLLHFSDFTFGFIMRGLGTVAGGIVGMLGWYIGSANGPGNPCKSVSLP